MKKYISILFTALVGMSLMTSCDKDTEGKTWVTTYPIMEIEGDTYAIATAGVPYSDAGFVAESGGEDLSGDVQISTSMDLQNPKPGYYRVVYSVTNDEGNEASAVRYVLVTDPNDPVAGYYFTNPASYREYNGGTVYFSGSYRIVVYGIGANTYGCSDLIGGWYAQRAGYGSNYAMEGKIYVDADGSVSMLSSYMPGWSDSATAMTEGTFDAATGTINWVVEYTDYPFFFHVQMTK